MFDAGAIVFHIKAAGAALFRQEMSEADKAAERLGRTSETASSKTEQLGKKQETAAEKARRLAADQAAAEKAAREYADAQEQVGKALVTAGAAIVGTTALTVKAAIDWESAWAGVTKTVDGTPEELEAIEDGLRGLSGVLPASHDEIAAVAEAAGQLGVKTKDVVGFTRTMIDLGETTNLTSEEAATSLAQLMNIMGTAGEDVDRLGSTIVALGNDGASTEAEIVSMAQRIAGSGKLVGATEGEVLALANALASMGVTAELGGGVASRILQDLYSAVETGGEKLEGFAAVAGVSASEFATAFRDDPVRAMGAFATGLNGVEQSGGNVVQTLSDLGFKSTEEQRVLLQLKSSGDLLTDSLELQNTAWQENSALTDEAAKRYDTVESQLGIMRNRVNDAAIDLGSVFLPVLADVAGGVGDFADGVASLPAPIQETIAVGALMAGMIALVGGTAMVAVPKIATLWGQVVALTAANTVLGGALRGTAAFLTGPWGIAFVAAAAGAVILQKHLEGLKTSTEEWQNIIANAKSADELFAATDEDYAIFSRLDEAIADAETFQSKLDLIANNDFLRGLDGAASTLKGSLQDIGKELATTAGTDLPAAQRAFRMLTEEYDLNAEQQGWLLDTMGEYKTALVDVANKQEINVTSADEAANATKLLELAQGEGADQSESAARAYVEAANGAAELKEDLQELLSVLNEANELGQNAISANIDYKNALADVDLTIQNARNGVEGYALTLDENTQSGRDNMDMLVGLASNAWAVVEADLAHGASVDEVRNKLVASREALIQRATDFGYTSQQAVALADDILGIPTESEWTMYAKTAEAQQTINTFITTNSGKQIPIKIIADGSSFKIPDFGGRVVSAPGQATGGPVYGPGTGTSDEVLRWLSNGEHVLTAREVQAAGGHREVERWRQSLVRGGAVPLSVSASVGVAAMSPTPPAAAAPAPGGNVYHVKVEVPADDPRIAARLVADELRMGLAAT